MPIEDGEPHYRVKSAADGHERALLEARMRPLIPKPAPAVERTPVAKAGQSRGERRRKAGASGEANGDAACSKEGASRAAVG